MRNQRYFEIGFFGRFFFSIETYAEKHWGWRKLDWRRDRTCGRWALDLGYVTFKFEDYGPHYCER